jgi:hypothetical protein
MRIELSGDGVVMCSRGKRKTQTTLDALEKSARLRHEDPDPVGR